MLIPRVDCITKYPAIFITGCFYCVSKYVLVLPFAKPSAFRIRSAALYCFVSFGMSSVNSLESPPTDGVLSLSSSLSSFSFRGFFPCASLSSLISFLRVPHRTGLLRGQCVSASFCCWLLPLHEWHQQKPQ